MLHKPSQDQAAGLRKMLGAHAPKKFMFLSAISHAQKNNTLLNISSACIHMGSSIQLLDFRTDASGISFNAKKLSHLWDIALSKCQIEKGYIEYSQGGRISKLAAQPLMSLMKHQGVMSQLSEILQQLFNESNTWLIDADIQNNNPFQLAEFNDSELLILVDNQPNSIKSGYLYLKSISQELGKKSVSLIIQNAEHHQAEIIHRNMSSAANQFLAIPLKFAGHIPNDASILKASQLGKSVLEAFPLSEASQAFRNIASRLLEYSTSERRLNSFETLRQTVLEH